MWPGFGLLALALLAAAWVYLSGAKVVPRARRRPTTDTRQSQALTGASVSASALATRALGSQAGTLEAALDRAGLRLSPGDYVVLTISGSITLAALGLLIWGPAGLLLLLLGPIGAYALLRVRTSRRQAAFGKQLDETLAILAGSLRAGYSLPQACITVATESEAPTSQEFARVINESRVGRPFTEAMAEVADRQRNDDFAWIVQAIAINREVGGNLADVLDGVSETIRERTHLRRQVDSLAAEGRLSAVVLGALPFVMFVVLSVANPTYIGQFGASLRGMVLIGVAVILLGIGILWLRASVRIKF